MNVKLPKRVQPQAAATFLFIRGYGFWPAMVIGYILACTLLWYGLDKIWPVP
jgi:hypothetical protein